MTTENSRADALTDARILEIAETVGVPDTATDDVLVKFVRACLTESTALQPAAAPIAWYTDWPGHRVYATAPHGWDEPGLHLSGDSIKDAWHPLYATPKPAPSPADERAAFSAWVKTQDSGVSLFDAYLHGKARALLAPLPDPAQVDAESPDWIKNALPPEGA